MATAMDRLAYGREDFRFIQSMMLQHAGINLHEGKQELVYSRLAKRIRSLGMDGFPDYCRYITADDAERLHCINAMTTNVTSFFRESHHFDFLRDTVLPGAEPLRVWSAGCSTGEEPYSIACLAHDARLRHPDKVVQVTATDLDSDVIDRARRGIYRLGDLDGLSTGQARRWFLKGRGGQAGNVRVRDEVRSFVAFSQLNLKDDFAFDARFDVIFCRNVMIYFNNGLRSRLLARFHDCLKPGGYLVLGHSESLFGLTTRYRVVGKTIHQARAD